MSGRRTCARLAAAVLLSAFGAGESRAQQAPLHRLTDINVGLDEGSSGAGHFVGAGTTTFFGAADLRGVGELWRTDGSEAGTTLVGAYPPGFGAGYGPWAALGAAVVVPLQPSQYPGADALWVSDGTPLGTRMIDLGGGAQVVQPTGLTTAGNSVFFFAWDPDLQLRGTDGSAAGTGVVRSFGVFGTVTNTMAWNGVLYFAASQDFGPVGLWRSDGTVVGTFAIGPAPLGPPVIGSDGLYFTSNRDLWRSNGTPAGTVPVTNTGDVDVGLSPSSPQPMGGQIYFVRVSNIGVCCGANFDLYRTNTPSPGITFLRRWIGNAEAGATILLQPAGDRLFINVPGTLSQGDPQKSLWVSDGTPAGTLKLRDFAGGMGQMRAGAGRELLFAGSDPATGFELWRSDGTAPGTQLVQDVRPGSVGSVPGGLTRIGDRLYFSADDGVHGSEPWAFDLGTTQARMLQNIAVGPGSLFPRAALVDASPVIFTGCSTATQCQLYSSDGTTAGTVPFFWFSPILPGSASGFGTAIGARDGGEILFSADEYPLTVDRLFHRSGPSAAPTLVTSWPRPSYMGPTLQVPGGWLFGLIVLGPRVQFQFWTSDGTPAGTQQVDLGLAPIDATYGLQQEFFEDRRGNQVLFGWKGAVDTAGSELWRSDGTPAGTFRLDDLAPGSADSSPALFTADPDYHVLFRAADPGGVNNRIYGTNGAPGGSVVLADFESVGPYAGVSAFLRATGVPGKPMIAMVWSEAYGTEPWTVDSSGAPLLLKDIYPGPNGSDYGFPYFSSRRFVAVGSTVFFRANDGVHGYELWKTDGTPDGTSLVRDTVPDGDSIPANVEMLMTAVGDRLLFTVCDDHGCEPWISDGSSAGTRGLMDVYPGPIGSNPQLIGRTGNLVLLAADSAATGRELWALRADAVDDPPILLGDLDGDGDFDPADHALFSGAYGTHAGDASFLIAADMNSDGAVTTQDEQLWAAAHLNASAPPIPVFPLLTPSTRGAL